MQKLCTLIFVALALAACSTPQETVFAARAAHNAALSVAVTYAERPSCSIPMAPAVCAKASVVEQIKKADDVATTALESAESTVRNPDFGSNVARSSAIAARAAVDAFTSILDSIE